MPKELNCWIFKQNGLKKPKIINSNFKFKLEPSPPNPSPKGRGWTYSHLTQNDSFAILNSE
jgi:hypothetical protein